MRFHGLRVEWSGVEGKLVGAPRKAEREEMGLLVGWIDSA
jgi:hypothetical protein